MREKLFQWRRYQYVQHFIIWEICSPWNRLGCHQFVIWLCFLNVCDPMHCDLRIRCLCTHFSLEVNFPALKLNGVREFSKFAFPRKEILGYYPSYHCENKFHQCNGQNTFSTVKNDFLIVWILLLKSHLQSWCCSVISGLTPREEGTKFFEFSKKSWGCPSWASSRSKTFPEIPIKNPRIGRQSRIAARHGSGTRNC